MAWLVLHGLQHEFYTSVDVKMRYAEKRKNPQQIEKSEDVSWIVQVKRGLRDIRFNIPSILLTIHFFLHLSNPVILTHQNASELLGKLGFKEIEIFQGLFHLLLNESRVSPGNVFLYQSFQT